MIGAGDRDLSVGFLFSFGDFVSVRIPDAEEKWKFDLRRDLDIYLGDQKRFCYSKSLYQA